MIADDSRKNKREEMALLPQSYLAAEFLRTPA
jgi:hypothetical protein